MTDPSRKIGKVIKRIRTEQDLTLEDVAKLTGVSKAMLGQIERGESNPTISVFWKIASGLRISFSELLEEDVAEYGIIDIDAMDAVYESEGKMKLVDVFPFNPITGFEYFFIELLPGAHHVSQEHPNAVEEYIVVTEGIMNLEMDGVNYELKAPAALVFTPNNTHTYSNPYEDKAVFQNIIKY
ncbi:MAG: helix-turn-helix domain-containing protein [Tissierellia bacterium]|nr:helix-turn-helix domain-containing protein [Tissierellia bacterium]